MPAAPTRLIPAWWPGANSTDVLLYSTGASAAFGAFTPGEAARLPQVVQSAVIVNYPVAVPAAADLLAPEDNAVPARSRHCL